MKEYNISDDALTLRYWQAVIAFGQIAVDTVLRQDLKDNQFSELAENIQISDDGSIRVNSAMILPGSLIYSIAGNENQPHDYTTDTSKTILGNVPRNESSRNMEAEGWRRMPAQEALLKYGAYCLFQSEDRGTGMCRERDPQRFPMFRNVVRKRSGETVNYIENPNDPPWSK